MPVGAITSTGSHPKLLWPGINSIWGQEYTQYPPEYVHLVDEYTSNRAYEEDYQVTGYGLAQSMPEGSGPSYVAEVGGVVSRYTHLGYALGYIVTHSELINDLYKKVSETRARRNAISMNQTVENLIAGMYNNAFSNTVTYGDGTSLINNAHPLVVGGTGSNVLNGNPDISEASLEDMVIMIQGATDDVGTLINLQPNKLIVPRQQQFNVKRILDSVLQTGTGNNDINAIKAMGFFSGGFHVNHFLTSTGAWFVRTSALEGTKLFWREKPHLMQENDFDTMNAKAFSYMMLSWGVSDWRGVYGSNGP